jgi:hypothetical protein
MTIIIHLPEAMLERVQAAANASGKDLDTSVVEAIEPKSAGRKRTLADLLKPLHDAVETSGLSEVEVQTLLEQEFEAHRRNR